MNTIAIVADVRAEGSLLSDLSDSGFLQDEQIAAALNLGQQAMLIWVPDDYEAVRDYKGLMPAMLKRRLAYKLAECYFTIGSLPHIMSNQQLTKAGLVKSKKIGESETTMGTPDDASKFSDLWERKAFRALYNYLGNKILGRDGKQIGFRTKDRKLSITGI